MKRTIIAPMTAGLALTCASCGNTPNDAANENQSEDNVLAGMGTVCCSPGMNYEAIREALSLPSTMKPMLYHPVGWEK